MSKIKINDILKSLSLKSILILVILLAFNSYAWFIYATKVAGTMDVHVSSWNVNFKAGEENLGTNITFDVATIKPGMDAYSKTLTINNTGEVSAKLTYKLQKARILSTTYTVNDTLTSDALSTQLQENYPFSITITATPTIIPVNGEGTFTISIEWPFEGGQDDQDTYWGEQAYEYYKVNPEGNAIHIELEIDASQAG